MLARRRGTTGGIPVGSGPDFGYRPSHPAPGPFTAQFEDRMSRKLTRASAIAVAATLVTILVSADGSGAAAESRMPQAIASQSEAGEPQTAMIAQPVVQPVPAEDAKAAPARGDDSDSAADAASENEPARSLAELVAEQPQSDDLSRELHCLAGAIYFEAKSESLAGQLAVGRVVVARSKSGRFPGSYCGVVYQHSQFSFVRGNSMPRINTASRQWANAVAIARIADEGSWRSPAEGALFFHAARVSPGWHLTRLARIDNHIFYR